MKLYLAGSCGSDQRTLMMGIAKALREKGFEVHCPFELSIPNAWDMSQEDWACKVFSADIHAIHSCDAMISISVGRNSTAGTNWEQGYAYGIHKPCHVIQITEAQTSLMTFWGCDTFHNATPETAVDAILDALEDGTDIACKTVLT